MRIGRYAVLAWRTRRLGTKVSGNVCWHWDLLVIMIMQTNVQEILGAAGQQYLQVG